MSDKSILEQATTIFKQQYPGLSAEAIVCFLVAMDMGDATVGDIAKATGMTEPNAYQHMRLLTSGGAGLLSLINAGDGRNMVQLTPKGQELRTSVNSAIGA